MSTDKWILLAEDNVNDADLAMRALNLEGSHPDVVVARDGVVALDFLHGRAEHPHGGATQPALVLLDLNMPRRDGFEVLEEMKRDKHLQHIPVVVFSSSKEPRDVVRCYRLGANAYVVKPVDFQKYVRTLKHVMLFWTVINECAPDLVPEAAEWKGKREPHWA